MNNKHLTSLISIIILFFLAACASQPAEQTEQTIEQLVSDITGELKENGPLTIAISDFPDMEGHLRKYSVFLSEELITYFYKSGRFTVIERRKLDDLIKEQQLGVSGLVDSAGAAALGKLAGADAIVVGSLAAGKENRIRINVRVLDVETAEVLASASTVVMMDPFMQSLWEEDFPQSPTNKEEALIADINLEKVIRLSINKPEGVLTQRDLNQVITIEAGDNKIYSLKGIEHCTNLMILDLGNRDWEDNNINNNNIIRDIRPLGELRNLEKIILFRCQINNDPLLLKELFSRWPEIKVVDLSYNNILNPDFLLPGTRLKALFMDGNENLTGLEQLLKHPALEWLHLGGIKLDKKARDIISQMTGLKAVQFWQTQLKDLDFLENLVHLRKLDITGNPITDISMLLNLHRQGAFPEGSPVSITHCGLDLKPGTLNREVLDTLLANGVNVNYKEGNKLK